MWTSTFGVPVEPLDVAGALDEDAAEGDPSVALQVEISHALFFTQLPDCRRDVGSDEDGRRVGGSLRNVVAQFQQRGTGVPRLPV